MTALPLLAALTLAHSCGGSVAPETLLSVVATESAFDPLSIGVNGRPHATLHPATREQAVVAAQAMIATGRDVDLGLAQINIRNLHRLGLSVSEAFDPCRNLRAGAVLLAQTYRAALRRGTDPQAALRQALSAYNTGDPVRGLHNGYVAKVEAAAAVVVPAIAATRASPPRDEDAAPVAVRPSGAAAEAAGEAPPVSLDVFTRGAADSLVWPDPPPRPAGQARREHLVTPATGDPS